MIECHACGKENEGAASGCVRCGEPLRQEGAAPGARGELGSICRRCEAYNEPGVRLCTACGLTLSATPAPPPTPPPTGVNMTMTSELRALSLSDEEAAEAAVPAALPAKALPPEALSRRPSTSGPIARAASHSTGIARGPAPSSSSKAPALDVRPEKRCPSCGANNPPAAKFCSECGSPFASQAATAHPQGARAPAPSIEIDASLEAHGTGDEALPTTESAPLALENPLPDIFGAEAWPPADEVVLIDSATEALPDERKTEPEWLPFQANLVVEKGSSRGARFPLGRRASGIGSAGAAIELKDDPFVAPLSATVMFVEERLVVRDHDSVNGVFVKLRDPAPLSVGDHFIAGERLFRFEGRCELAETATAAPLLGSPRPGEGAVRVVEVLAGGKTGRTCHRAGPSLTIGRTGCDMNFPGDALLAARHAELRIAEDGGVVLADLGQAPSGVLLRVRRQSEQGIQSGDLLQIGEQQLRIEIA